MAVAARVRGRAAVAGQRHTGWRTRRGTSLAPGPAPAPARMDAGHAGRAANGRRAVDSRGLGVLAGTQPACLVWQLWPASHTRFCPRLPVHLITAFARSHRACQSDPSRSCGAACSVPALRDIRPKQGRGPSRAVLLSQATHTPHRARCGHREQGKRKTTATTRQRQCGHCDHAI